MTMQRELLCFYCDIHLLVILEDGSFAILTYTGPNALLQVSAPQ